MIRYGKPKMKKAASIKFETASVIYHKIVAPDHSNMTYKFLAAP
jgi:hypothetical protein